MPTFTKAQFQALVDRLPDQIEVPDLWPVPGGAPGVHARVQVAEASNRVGDARYLKFHMEAMVDAVAFPPVEIPTWVQVILESDGMADPELVPFLGMTEMSVHCMGWIKWARALAAVLPPAPEPEPTPDPAPAPDPIPEG